jgi:hypothetical protein
MSDAPAASVPEGWFAIVDALEDAMPPEWTNFARGSGDTDWMRAMLMLDAHDRLGRPTTTEHVAHTLHHLAQTNSRDLEAKGWEVLHDKRREERRQMLLLIESEGPGVLSGEPLELFHRSLIPTVIEAPRA